MPAFPHHDLTDPDVRGLIEAASEEFDVWMRDPSEPEPDRLVVLNLADALSGRIAELAEALHALEARVPPPPAS
jgi:hypothetical protein